MAYALRRRPGTEGFYLDLDGKKIGNVFAPIPGTCVDGWAITVDGDFTTRENLPPPIKNFYREYPTLEDAAEFLGAEVPPALVFAPWAYQDGFVSGVAA